MVSEPGGTGLAARRLLHYALMILAWLAVAVYVFCVIIQQTGTWTWAYGGLWADLRKITVIEWVLSGLLQLLHMKQPRLTTKIVEVESLILEKDMQHKVHRVTSVVSQIASAGITVALRYYSAVGCMVQCNLPHP